MERLPVYVIDDDEAALASTEFLLTALGIPARSFSDPYAFLQALGGLEPGCVLTDLRMPTMSGIELHAALVKKGIGWPVVLMSGNSALEANATALQSGMVGMLEKPFTREALLNVLDRAFSKLVGERAA